MSLKPATDGHTGRTDVFQGEYAITIDDKGRMVIPTGLREDVSRAGNRLVITYNPFDAGSLYLYPYAVWEGVRDQINGLSRTKQRNRTLQLKLVGAAAVVEPDGSARISIPANQRNTVGIERKAVLVGMGDKFELWSEQAHQEQIRQTLGDEDMAGDELEGLQL